MSTSPTVDIGASSFAEHTTLRVGGSVARWIIARSEEACVEAIVECDDIGGPVLVVGGGSNIVCSDEPFDGTVVQVANTGVSVTDRGGHLRVVAAAGEPWDDVVVRTMEAGSAAFAPLSGIPGLIGATPIQNVGAYGAEVSQFITDVRVWDRQERAVRQLTDEECSFGYRSSALKSRPDRFVVLEVAFAVPEVESVVVDYRQLADRLGVAVGEECNGELVREKVLGLRRSKGMVLDADDRDTWTGCARRLSEIPRRTRRQGECRLAHREQWHSSRLPPARLRCANLHQALASHLQRQRGDQSGRDRVGAIRTRSGSRSVRRRTRAGTANGRMCALASFAQ